MSSVGLYAGAYRDVRDWAELVDRVIAEVAIRGTGDGAGSSDIAKLAELLDRASQRMPGDRIGWQLALLFEPAKGVSFQAVAATLRGKESMPSNFLTQLDALAQALERQRLGVLEHLRRGA